MNLNTTAANNAGSAAILTFSSGPAAATSQGAEDASSPRRDHVIIGRQSFVTGAVVSAVLPTANDASKAIVEAMLDSIGDSGKAASFLPSDVGASATKVSIVLLPPASKITRNNHPFSPHVVTDSLADVVDKGKDVRIHVIDGQIEEYVGCVSAAVARALPLYDSKSKGEAADPAGPSTVDVAFYDGEGLPVEDEALLRTARAVSKGVRLAARLGDMPPAELDPDAYAAECESIARSLVEGGANVSFQEVAGEALKDGGYGGIYGVGMAARCPPRMIVMTYTPDGGFDGEVQEHVALCGKGVVYDTGGLALKPKVGMCGMKHDMGGSAGVLGGFQAAVELKVPCKITLILAIVENAIGPESARNDDILTMKSGKTVEINNTDAEGRLILADCVSHASNSIGKVDTILDMATLTGAVSITTGKKHAGILAKTAEMEQRIFQAGLKSGDLVFPMLVRA
ncbi:hypothetical protein ACHAWF_013317 [Thalassiosira exigua]